MTLREEGLEGGRSLKMSGGGSLQVSWLLKGNTVEGCQPSEFPAAGCKSFLGGKCEQYYTYAYHTLYMYTHTHIHI